MFTQGQTLPGGVDLKSGVTCRIVPCNFRVAILGEFVQENPL